MKGSAPGFASIDAYIATFPKEIQEKLEDIRAAIKAAAPEAQEKISYQMPTFYQHGNLVHFAAYKNHIGFYPTPSGVLAFKTELSLYETSKGAIQFPLDKPTPLDLVRKITTFRVAENLERVKAKSSRIK